MMSLPVDAMSLAPIRRGLAWLLALTCLAAGLHAQLPAGGAVVAGQATIANSANSTTITAGNNSGLRWGSFDGGAGQTVQFIPPGAPSRGLNWIRGPPPSTSNASPLPTRPVHL